MFRHIIWCWNPEKNQWDLETVASTEMASGSEKQIPFDESVHIEEYKHTTYQSSVKLPKLDIPFFNGNTSEWTEWWDFFQVTVDQNRQLSDREKLLYLNSRDIGDAKQAISGLRMTNENYRAAIELLKERFNDTQLLLHFHYTELINLPPANNSSKGLRSCGKTF